MTEFILGFRIWHVKEFTRGETVGYKNNYFFYRSSFQKITVLHKKRKFSKFVLQICQFYHYLFYKMFITNIQRFFSDKKLWKIELSYTRITSNMNQVTPSQCLWRSRRNRRCTWQRQRHWPKKRWVQWLLRIQDLKTWQAFNTHE